MPSVDGEIRREESEKYFYILKLKFLLILTTICLGSCHYIPSPTLMDLGAKIKEDIFQMPLIFVCRAVGYIMGSIFGIYMSEVFQQWKQRNLLFFISMICLSFTSLMISFATNLLALSLLFSVTGVCMAALVTGVDAFCVNYPEDLGIPFYQTLSTFYTIGSIFAPLLARNYNPKKPKDRWQDLAIHMTTVAYAYRIFAGGAFMLSLMWLYNYCVTTFNTSVVSEQVKKSEALGNVMRSIAIFSTSVLDFLGASLTSSYILLLPSYCVLTFDMTHNESCNFLLLFLGLTAVGRFISNFISSRIEPPKFLLLGMGLVLFGVIVMYLQWEFSGSNFWLASVFIGLGSGPLLPSLFVWISRKLEITSQIILSLHVARALSELVVPMTLVIYLLNDDENSTNRNGFLLTIALLYLIFLLFQYILLSGLCRKKIEVISALTRFRGVALSDRTVPAKTWRSEQCDCSSGTVGVEDEDDLGRTSESVIQQLSDLKNRINKQNHDIRLTFQGLVYSGSQVK